jgi:hypothetical protein
MVGIKGSPALRVEVVGCLLDFKFEVAMTNQSMYIEADRCRFRDGKHQLFVFKAFP